MKNTVKNNENDSSKLQWTLFVIVIPVLFTVTFITVILTVAGVDVAGKMKEAISHIPGTADLTSVEEKNNSENTNIAPSAELKEENERQKTTIEKQQQEISALENEADLKVREIEQLSQEVKSLKEQLQASDNKEKEGKDIAKLYEKMSSKKAAEIIPFLSDEEALKILTSINDDQVIAVMEKMPAEDAARYTKMLADS
ncbi:MotE family protein [Metabacillus idriensis]|uniref:MotE family protein n=1 Tax=Metabacillus idriensis TaxID=324768 RepID=UPI003D273BDD